ncbi:hypothetical protein GCM10028833_26900 [Glycomyces tarimensis]
MHRVPGMERYLASRLGTRGGNAAGQALNLNAGLARLTEADGPHEAPSPRLRWLRWRLGRSGHFAELA